MPAPVTTDLVWKEIERRNFGVLAFVTPGNKARSTGIVYVARNRQLFVGTRRASWKAKHIASNPHLSMTVTIPKRILFMPWIKIPAATITFSGKAALHNVDELPDEILHSLLRGVEADAERAAGIVIIRVQPEGDFLTYGVGVPLLTMRKPDQARGRTPVS